MTEKEAKELAELAEKRKPERVAHEAGHAVINFVLGIEFSDVVVKLEGYVSGYCDIAREVWEKTPPEHQVISLYAGYVSQLHFYGTGWGSSNDHNAAADILGANPSLGGADAMMKQTEQLVSEHAESIKRVADELSEKERITWQQVKELIESWWEK